MPSTKKTAGDLSTKLIAFRAGLPAAEQQALDSLLEIVATRIVTAPRGRGLTVIPGASDAILEARANLATASGAGGGVAITPTWTTVTITTTVASHPVITCVKAGPSRDALFSRIHR